MNVNGRIFYSCLFLLLIKIELFLVVIRSLVYNINLINILFATFSYLLLFLKIFIITVIIILYFYYVSITS